MTNHILEKPNDWWQLHLPLVISLKLTHIPVTHQRYDTPPHSSKKRVSVVAVGGRATVRRQHTPPKKYWMNQHDYKTCVKNHTDQSKISLDF